MSQDLSGLPTALLDWYSRAARELAWRIGPSERAIGKRPDPYKVWLAEIMLQQTTIPHGTRYFIEFSKRWPSVFDLAAAKDEDVMAAWAGLGYYARARNLLKCARIVAERGAFPETSEELVKLPGIGPYTAGAMGALAFGEQIAAVDGNVERVFSRLLALEDNWDQAKKKIRKIVSGLVPEDRPAEFAEGLMDLGATICTPKSPDCPACPVQKYCKAKTAGEQERYPIKAKKKPKPHRTGHVYLLTYAGKLLLERRPDSGLLGGMLGLPGSDWAESKVSKKSAKKTGAPIDTAWSDRGEVVHVFTHFSLTLQVWQAEAQSPPPKGHWVEIKSVNGLPSVFAKAVKLLV